MAKQVINRGTVANDGTGESPFTGMGKVNDNFTELYNKDATLDIDVSQRLKVSDGEKDFILAGLSTPVPSPASATGIMSAGNGYVNGTRVEKSTTTSYTYTASSDTYNDIDSAGAITRVVVANAGTPAAVVAGRVRLEKVVTNGATPPIITSVTRLAPDRVMLLGTRNSDGSVSGIKDPTGVNTYGFALIPKDVNGNIVANTTPRSGTLTNLLNTVAGGVGEISVATDRDVLVRHNGVAGGAKAYGRGRIIADLYHDWVEGATADASATVYTPITFDTASNSLFGDTTLIVTSEIIPPAGAKYIQVSGGMLFAANATGTNRRVRLEGWTGTVWGNLQTSNGFNPNTAQGVPVLFDFVQTIGTYLKFRILVNSDATVALGVSKRGTGIGANPFIIRALA